ncbi:hypothetical protein E0H75_42365 [Kribbella capetownensis]|uniref:GAF domain-containing protein n=1 Tax=Kribbella capetownensis TaxID=1572659 RepID=A0A4R0IK78_9ACTN|nr:hypothetical protein [Kribbella capetownensis]TCC33901.1 hypothetical protein E0H75_42365 [Kribbella capetownensis]
MTSAGSPKPSRFPKRLFLWIPLAGVAAAVGYWLQIKADDAQGQIDWWILDVSTKGLLAGIGAGLTFLSVVGLALVAAYETAAAERVRAAITAQQQRQLELSQAVLRPLVDAVNSATHLRANSPQRRHLPGETRTAVLAVLCKLATGAAEPVARYYELTRDGGGKRVLQPVKCWGGDAGHVLKEGDPIAAPAFDALDKSEAKYWVAGDPEAPTTGWSEANIIVPVAGSRPYGVLTVESSDTDAFLLQDVNTAALIGQLYAATLGALPPGS